MHLTLPEPWGHGQGVQGGCFGEENSYFLPQIIQSTGRRPIIIFQIRFIIWNFAAYLFAQSYPEDLIGLSWLVTAELLMLELIYSLLIYSWNKSMKKEEQNHY